MPIMICNMSFSKKCPGRGRCPYSVKHTHPLLPEAKCVGNDNTPFLVRSVRHVTPQERTMNKTPDARDEKHTSNAIRTKDDSRDNPSGLPADKEMGKRPKP